MWEGEGPPRIETAIRIEHEQVGSDSWSTCQEKVAFLEAANQEVLVREIPRCPLFSPLD